MFKSKRQCVLAMLVSGIVFWGTAMATDSPAPKAGTAGDLRAIVSETVLLKAAAAREAARQDLRQKGGGATAGALGATAESDGLPRVSGIFEARGVKSATFVYPNGQLEQPVGGTLPGGLKVLSISADAGIVEIQVPGGKKVVIPVSKESGLLSQQPGGGGDQAQGSNVAGRSPIIPTFSQPIGR